MSIHHREEEIKYILHGYLLGARTPVKLQQCAAILPITCRHEEILDIIEQELLIHLSGEVQNSIYYPPYYWSDRLDAMKEQLTTTGYLSVTAFSELNISIEKVKNCSDVFVAVPVSSSSSSSSTALNQPHKYFLVTKSIVDALKVALRELRDEEEQWWLHVSSICPTAMSDEDIAAILSYCLMELIEREEEKVNVVSAGIFAIHSHPMLRLQNALLLEMGKMKNTLQCTLKLDTDVKKLVSKHMTKQHIIELMHKHIQLSMDVIDGDDHHQLFLSALYDHLHTTIEESFIAMVEGMILQKGRCLILTPNQTNRLQKEGDRDVIFQRQWSLLLLSMKACQFTNFDEKDLHGIKHRCVTIASLLTSFVCWEHNIAVPSTLLAYFSTIYPDGTIELDFDSRSNLPPLLGLSFVGVDDADDLVQLTKDDLKRMLKELPKEAAVGVIEMWEMIENDSSSLCSNFCQYFESRANSIFRVITTKPDKKSEKFMVNGIKTDLIKIFSVGCSNRIPLSLSSLPAVASSGSPNLEFLNHLVVFAYIEITASFKGVIIPRPLLSISVLTKLVRWLESQVHEESSTKNPTEREIKLQAISSLQTLIHQNIT